MCKIFCKSNPFTLCARNKTEFAQCDKKWSKIHGVYTDITSICAAIRGDSKVYDHNAVSISFIERINESSVDNLDRLDCSFMYTQILREILFTIDFTQEHISQFLAYCREQFADSTTNLDVVKKIENEYDKHPSVWWYTSDTFLYGMLNHALRLMDVDVIVKTGFFLRDIHRNITRLHDEQFGDLDMWDPFLVYRGQSLSVNDFNKLKSTQGGLLSFNNFLSTSCIRTVANLYVESNLNDSNVMGVLFVITVDPSISVASFASITGESYYSDEGEILFSMHSIFRIGEMKQIEDNERRWEVELTLSNDNDPQLMAVMKTMQEETSSTYAGWHRLSKLLSKLGQYDKAQELYETLLEQTNDEEEQAHIYNKLGTVYNCQGNNPKAIRCYAKSIEITKKKVTPRRPIFIESYHQMGRVCNEMGRYSEAVKFYEQGLRISKKYLLANHSNLGNIYSGIGSVYMNMKEYPKAFEYLEKAFEIAKEKLPPTHPTLATCCNNLAMALKKMNEHSKALEYYRKAFDIRKKILPPNHPDFAFSLTIIASEYQDIGDYSKALEYYENAFDIWQKTLSENHPNLATAYDNIGLVCAQMNKNLEALKYYEKALEIREKIFFQNHPDLALSYNRLGKIYHDMGEQIKSLEYFEKAIEILEKTPTPNNSDLALIYTNLGGVYTQMGEYAKSIEYYHKGIVIIEKNLPSSGSKLVIAHNNLGMVYKKMNNYSKALEHYEKGLEISQKFLPPNDHHSAISYNNIAQIFKTMSNYEKALEYFQRALEILRHSLPPNHPKITSVEKSIKIVKKKL